MLACPDGLEPPTCCLEGSCSIQLSYGQLRAVRAAGPCRAKARDDTVGLLSRGGRGPGFPLRCPCPDRCLGQVNRCRPGELARYSVWRCPSACLRWLPHEPAVRRGEESRSVAASCRVLRGVQRGGGVGMSLAVFAGTGAVALGCGLTATSGAPAPDAPGVLPVPMGPVLPPGGVSGAEGVARSAVPVEAGAVGELLPVPGSAPPWRSHPARASTIAQAPRAGMRTDRAEVGGQVICVSSGGMQPLWPQGRPPPVGPAR